MLMLKLVVILMLVAASRAAEVCCTNPDIGCFSDDPPFDGFPLPDCIDIINPSYTMFTRDNPIVGEPFDHTSAPPVFSGLRRTAFIVHGYQNNGQADWMREMKDAFLDREDINIVIVGWEGGADVVFYLLAASNTRTTGAYTALVIDNLVNNGTGGGGDYALMWCVGHSLGSHVCGHTGMNTLETMGRITGLDPAGPSFESSNDITIGLNPDCANFTDVMHTDTATYGTLRPLGHIDFYPAEGHDQPGCGVDIDGCSHERATIYMEESIREDCFQSRSQCENHIVLPGSCSDCRCDAQPCAFMGYAADTSCHMTGIYYLDIDNSDPYCVS